MMSIWYLRVASELLLTSSLLLVATSSSRQAACRLVAWLPLFPCDLRLLQVPVHDDTRTTTFLE